VQSPCVSSLPVSLFLATCVICSAAGCLIAFRHGRANVPHNLTKAAGPQARGAEPPWAAPNARARHAGCSSLLPRHASVAAAVVPLLPRRRGGRLLQLRVSALAGPHE